MCSVYGPLDHYKKHEYSPKCTITCTLNYAQFSRHERVIDNNGVNSKEYSNIIVESLSSRICIKVY